jgi:hypothetical protein
MNASVGRQVDAMSAGSGNSRLFAKSINSVAVKVSSLLLVIADRKNDRFRADSLIFEISKFFQIFAVHQLERTPSFIWIVLQ